MKTGSCLWLPVCLFVPESECFHDGKELLDREGGSSYEAAVNVWSGHEVFRVLGIHASSVEDGAVVCYFLSVLACDSLADMGVDLLCLIGRGCLTGTDCPDRFVGNDETGKVFGRKLKEGFPDLFVNDGEMLACFALFQYFSDTEYGSEVVGEG